MNKQSLSYQANASEQEWSQDFYYKNEINPESLRVTDVPETLSNDDYNEIYAKMLPIIQKIVRITQPEGKKLLGDPLNKTHEVLEEWKENILGSFNKLVSENRDDLFLTETKNSQLNEFKDEADIIANISYKKSKKRNRQNKKELKQDRDNIKEKTSEYVADQREMAGAKGDDVDEVIGYVSNQDQTDINTEENWLDSEIDGLKNGFGNTLDATGEWYSDHTRLRPESEKFIDPSILFSLSSGKAFKINLITLEDITALVTPRSKDSIIDKNPDKAFEEVSKIDKEKLAKEWDSLTFEQKVFLVEHNMAIMRLTSERYIADNGQLGGPIESGHNKSFWDNLKDRHREKATFYWKEFQYGEKIDQNLVRSKESEWREEQEKDGNKHLSDQYSKLYHLFPDKGNWKENKIENVDDPDVREKDPRYFSQNGDEYIASNETMTEFHEWLRSKGEDPDKTKGVEEQMSGWDIDKVKIDVLSGMSKEIINEQKWAITPGGGPLDAHNDAGTEKDEYIQERLGANDLSMVGFGEAGVYNEEKEKRYPGYGQGTSYIEKIDSEEKVKERIIWMIDYDVELVSEEGDGH